MTTKRFHSNQGFSLIELMVALAMTAIIVLAINYILSTAGTTATLLGNHQNADFQARTVFNRMALDFSQMVKRNDIDCIFFSNIGNDSMYFYSEAPSYNNAAYAVTEKNSVSLIGYRINSDVADVALVQPMELERLGKALTWNAAATPQQIFLGYNTAVAAGVPPQLVGTTISTYASGGNTFATSLGHLASGYSDGVDPDFHPLGSQVLRMKISFLLKDGTQSNIPVVQNSVQLATYTSFKSAMTWPTPGDDINAKYVKNSRWYDSTNKVGYICTDPSPGMAIWNQIGLQDIKAIIVTIAVLDQQGESIISQAHSYATEMAKFAANLEDIPTANGVMTTTTLPANGTYYNAGDAAGYLVYRWNQDILPGSGLSAATGLPKSVISQTRIYQRYFFLNAF